MIDKTKGMLLKGTSWTAFSFVVLSIVYLLRISILTRFLDKSDFGLVAIVLFVLGFTNIFADLGVSTALLSRNNISKREYSSLYWGSVFLSLLLYVVLFLITPIISNFYDSPDLKYLLPIMGLDIIISNSGRQFSVFMQKSLQFKQLAIVKIISELLSLILVVILAFKGAGIWSLVFSILFASTINSLFLILINLKSKPLIFYFNYKESKTFYRIGFFQTGSQILDYLSSQIDILILGKLLPLGEMGLYSIIKTLVFRIYGSMNQIITKVTIPIFASLQDKVLILKDRYLSMINVIAFINALVFLVLAIQSKEILFLFYGKEYVESSLVLEILCIWGLFSSIVSCASSIIIALGRTEVGFRWTQIRVLCNPIFIVLGAYLGGIIGVAIAQAVYAFLFVFVYWKIVVFRILDIISIYEFVKSFYKPVLLSFILGPMIFFIKSIIDIKNIYISTLIYGFGIIIMFFAFFGKMISKQIRKI